jgi:hypothetical protein
LRLEKKREKKSGKIWWRNLLIAWAEIDWSAKLLISYFWQFNDLIIAEWTLSFWSENLVKKRYRKFSFLFVPRRYSILQYQISIDRVEWRVSRELCRWRGTPKTSTWHDISLSTFIITSLMTQNWVLIDLFVWLAQ